MSQDDLYALCDGAARALMNAGKLVGAGWYLYRRFYVPHGATQSQVAELRKAFYFGAQYVFASIARSATDDSEDPTEADLARMERLAGMIKAAVLGLAAAGAVIAAEAGTDKILALREARSAATSSRATEARKTHEINVPRIKDGVVKGYAVMLLSYSVDLGALRAAAMAPDSILVDEAFRYVYNDDTIDFDHLDRFDFVKMSKALVAAINTRVKADVVVDVGVQEFTYEPISETHGRPAP